MKTDEPRLKVQCGQQVFGPMSVTDLAELLAAERFSGSDLVSERNGPWVTIEEYVARQSEPPPSESGPDSDYMLQSAPDESDYVPLSESLDPSPAKSRESSSTRQPDFYGIPRSERLEEPPPAPPESIPHAPISSFPQSAEPSTPLPDELELDDALEALAADEADAPEVSRRRRKRTASKGVKRSNSKRTKRKRKRR